MAFHMGSVRWVSSPSLYHLPPLSPQMHQEETLHLLHSKDLDLVNLHRPHVRRKQSPLLLGKFLSTRLYLISHIILPVGFQSHILLYHCQAKDHILESQLCDSLNPELCALSLGFQTRQIKRFNPCQIFHWLLLHNRCRFAVCSLSSSHGDDLQENLLLPDGDGNAARDGGRRHGIGEHRDGVGPRILRNEDRKPKGIRQGANRVLGDGVFQRTDMAAVLSGHSRDGVFDVFINRRHLHDSLVGHERAGRSFGVWRRVWRRKGGVDSAVLLGVLFICVWFVREDEGREKRGGENQSKDGDGS